ncbi:hypothetical protein VNI00_012171 [Paramarasmius palmivorus]|uniref:Protein kinase domain-containing protein n=1 Tax=Paramarasmius palmivorus TaxID=297713 RepID=A0AAW0C5J8_9AGAR
MEPSPISSETLGDISSSLIERHSFCVSRKGDTQYAQRAQTMIISGPDWEETSVHTVKKSISMPPVIDIDTSVFDDAPFSRSFNGMLTDEELGESEDSRRCTILIDASFNVEQIKDIKEIVPEWDDDEVDEIVVLSPKPRNPMPNRLSTIMEDLQERDKRQNVIQQRDTEQCYIVKRFKTTPSDAWPTELSVLELINDRDAPFLPQICWRVFEDSCFSVILDFHSGGSLCSYIEAYDALSLQHSLAYAAELVEALSVIHAAGIQHRNITPDSIMIDATGHLVLVGFDQAQLEAVKSPSFSSENEVDKQKIIRGQPLSDIGAAPVVSDLLNGCLEPNPALRLTIAEIKTHEYFGSVNWSLVQEKNIKAVPRIRDEAIRTSVSSRTSILPQCSPRTAVDSPTPSYSDNYSVQARQSTPGQQLVQVCRTHSINLEYSLPNPAPTYDSLRRRLDNEFTPALTPEERMARFWASLDEERDYFSPDPETCHYIPTRLQRRNKLRKKLSTPSSPHLTSRSSLSLSLASTQRRISRLIKLSSPATLKSTATTAIRKHKSSPSLKLIDAPVHLPKASSR